MIQNNFINVQTKGNGEINGAYYYYCKNCILILYPFEGVKKPIDSMFLIDSKTIFYHQRM